MRDHPNDSPAGGCIGKAALTWARAQEIVSRATEVSKGRKRRAYHCRFCRAWHIGGNPKKIRRAD